MSRTRTIFSAAVAALALCLAAATIASPAQASATASAQGKILNAYTGAPMPGATARLFRHNGTGWQDTGRVSSTNSMGQYYFGSLLQGYVYNVRGNASLGTSCLYGIVAYTGFTGAFQASGARTGLHAWLYGSRVC